MRDSPPEAPAAPEDDLVLRGDLWMGDTRLIRNLALEILARGWSVLLGPSGVGKSTLARLLAGLPGP